MNKKGYLCKAVIVFFIFFSFCVAPGCRGKKKEIIRSNEDVLKEAHQNLQKGKLRKTLTVLKNVGIVEEVSKEIAPQVLLATADSNFYLGDLMSIAEAAKSYSEFITFYSDHARAAYAQFQIGMCYYKITNTPENDQEQTFMAIDEFKKVKTIDPDSPFVRAAEGMIQKCEDKVAENEFLIGKFYYNKKAYTSAADRFRNILNKYSLYGEKEKIYYYLGDSLLKMDNSSEGKIYLDKLVNDYPQSKYAHDANEILSDIKR